jgi:hypothetical protein
VVVPKASASFRRSETHCLLTRRLSTTSCCRAPARRRSSTALRTDSWYLGRGPPEGIGIVGIGTRPVRANSISKIRYKNAIIDTLAVVGKKRWGWDGKTAKSLDFCK